MSSMIEELGDYLQTQGVGTLAEDLFLGGLPDEPDAAVAIQEYQGEAPAFAHGTSGVNIEQRRFQVIGRGLTSTAAGVLAQGANAVLIAVKNRILGGTYYVGIYPLQSPFPLGKDGNGRYRFVCNYRVEKAVSA